MGLLWGASIQKGVEVVVTEVESANMFGENAKLLGYTVVPPYFSQLNLSKVNTTGAGVFWQREVRK